MKFVLFSDLHLDAPFKWDGPELDIQMGVARRATLLNILQLVDEVGADALLCAGDLYEHSLSPDETGEFLRKSFAEIAPVPIYVSPGNHDWMGPTSLYQRVDWSPNVHIFGDDVLQTVPLEDGLTLWGAAYRSPANNKGFLDSFHTIGQDVHLALFHGANNMGVSYSYDKPGDSHARFYAERIPDSGLHHAFIGHFHRHRDAEYFTYPGNPNPLSFAEGNEPKATERGAVVATVNPDGSVERQRRRVAATDIHDLFVDVTGVDTPEEVDAMVLATLGHLTGVGRVTLSGEPGFDISTNDFGHLETQLDAVQYLLAG